MQQQSKMKCTCSTDGVLCIGCRRLEPKPDAAGERDIALIEACKALCWMCARGMDFEWSKGDPIHWQLPDGARTRHVEGRCEAEKIRRLMLLSAPHSRDQSEWIESVVRDVAELPDRNSPEGWPESMLVTGDELREIITRHYKGGSNA